jgi:hypothetical protein
MKPLRNGTLLSRLAGDAAGNVLAVAAASTFAIMGVVGGAVDISRTYMVESRLQQACDAGALAARKDMGGESLTTANKAVGYKYFDFNFKDGDYGSKLISREYSQFVNDAGTPQAVVNGTMVATVPTTVMRIFGNEEIDLTVNCTSKMDVANADVAMVLDVTLSMTLYSMPISSSGSATETRLAAMRKAVKAFYDALGPGRAGGDLSKGRIRYAFIPYGTNVNVGYLLTHDQMANSWSYQSREAKSTTTYGWTHGNYNSVSDSSSSWSVPAGPSDAYSNDNAYNSFSIVSGSNTATFTMQDGSVRVKKNTSATNTTQCSALNQYGSYDEMVGIQQNNGTWGSSSYTTDSAAPIYPAATVPASASQSRTNEVTYGYRYRWFNNSGNGCWLERASKKTSGNPDEDYSETRTAPTTRAVTWTPYTGVQYVYAPRTLTVSGLKGSGSSWNTSISVPALNRSGSTTTYNIKLSGETSTTSITVGGTASAGTADWQGCVEERQIDNTIDDSTSITSIPANAYDLNTNLLATTSNAATQWKPFLPDVVYTPNASSTVNGTSYEYCPAPALKLQEIGDYANTIITSNYPTLFDAASGGASSIYYPYQSGGSNAWKNVQSLRNYIDRIPTTMGTLHDAGFIWGLHLVSGEGMFAAENPDRYNDLIVSRHIVFMTDGEMSPAQDKYVFSGYNDYDGRLAPTDSTDDEITAIENRRLRILCEAAKDQGITVWVVAITANDTTADTYADLEACASSTSHFKSAATSEELINSFTTIAQSIGGLRISE